jgi:hypothetical protein
MKELPFAGLTLSMRQFDVRLALMSLANSRHNDFTACAQAYNPN